jgi:integrase
LAGARRARPGNRAGGADRFQKGARLVSEKRVKVWVQHYADRPHLLLQWIDPDTNKRKNKSAGTADEKEAEAKRIDLEADLNNGRFREASRMTWERFRELFEEEYLYGARPRTREHYAVVFQCFEECVRPRLLRAINERTLSAFLAAMRRRPGKARGSASMAPTTMHCYLSLIHTALAWGVRQKLLPAVPEFPAVKVPKKRPQPVPLESFERLLAKAPNAEWRALLLGAWLAGLRVGEAYALQWEPTDKAPWLDFSRNRIWLPAEFAKGDADQWVPLDPNLRPVLEALPRLGAVVFPLQSQRGKRMALSTVSDRIIRMAKSAGVKLTAHALRRGFGCRYAGKVPAQVLQRLMRHSDIRITMDYYANVDAAVEEAVLGPRHNKTHNITDHAGEVIGGRDGANATPGTGNG